MRILIPSDLDWPTGLESLAHRAPLALWAKGTTSLLRPSAPPAIAIVGARAATGYGETVATELAGELADQGIPVVSGGAYGIDAAAHRSTILRGGRTIAVLPSGLDRLYPSGNQSLFDRIAETGLLLSEQPPGTAPTRWRMEQRARIIAAISTGVLLVEAGVRSSTINVIREAHTQGRPVGAVPGPVTSASSALPNQVIQGGQATMITSSWDIGAFLLKGQRHLTRERQIDADLAGSATEMRPGTGLHR